MFEWYIVEVEHFSPAVTLTPASVFADQGDYIDVRLYSVLYVLFNSVPA